MPRVGCVVWVGQGDDPGVVSFGIEGISRTSRDQQRDGARRRTLSSLPLGAPVGAAPMRRSASACSTTTKNFSLSSRLLFSVNGAVGVEIPVAGASGVTMGYRFRHSNAGRDEVNPARTPTSSAPG
jgi:hypothetical protein